MTKPKAPRKPKPRKPKAGKYRFKPVMPKKPNGSLPFLAWLAKDGAAEALFTGRPTWHKGAGLLSIDHKTITTLDTRLSRCLLPKPLNDGQAVQVRIRLEVVGQVVDLLEPEP